MTKLISKKDIDYLKDLKLRAQVSVNSADLPQSEKKTLVDIIVNSNKLENDLEILATEYASIKRKVITHQKREWLISVIANLISISLVIGFPFGLGGTAIGVAYNNLLFPIFATLFGLIVGVVIAILTKFEITNLVNPPWSMPKVDHNKR